MKVAAVFWGPQAGQGGTHTFAQDILETLQEAAAQSQHEFVYYVVGGPPGSSDMLTIPYTRRERYRRAAIYRLRDMLDHAGMPRRRLHTWLERSLAKEGVDLVWFATNYVEQCDQPYIMTIFDVEHVRQPWFPEVSADGEWERRHYHFSRYLPKATRAVVPNAAGRDQIVRHFGIDPERVLCLPHPTPAFAREAAHHEPLPHERVERLGLSAPYIFYPAQFWAHKNHATLFDTVAELARDGGERYELALSGSDKGQLAHVRSLVHDMGLADLVHFLGFVDGDDLVALYQHAHALTYLSLFGPENLPPLEAFALGCPVVAADVPGAREQLGDAALLVAPTDPTEIAGAVRKLEDPALRKELIERGHRRAADRTPAEYVDGVLRFLDEFERARRCWGANGSMRTE